jgi:hypothetical protein
MSKSGVQGCFALAAGINALLVSSLAWATTPAPLGPVAFNGGDYAHGEVIAHPHVYVTYWGMGTQAAPNDTNGVIPYVKGFFANIGGSKWLDIVEQYSPTLYSTTNGAFIANEPGMFTPGTDEYYDNSALNNDGGCCPAGKGPTSNPPCYCPSGTAVAAEAYKAAVHFKAAANPNAIQVIITNQTRAYNGDNCGYHEWVPISGSGAPDLVYIDLPTGWETSTAPNTPPAGSCQYAQNKNPIDTVVRAMHHEFMEAITNPRGTGWGRNNFFGEIGDGCFGTATVQLESGSTREYMMSAAYSNDAYLHGWRSVWSASAAGHGAGLDQGCVGSWFTRQNRYVTSGGSLWFGGTELTPAGTIPLTFGVGVPYSNWGKPSSTTLVGTPAAISVARYMHDVFALGQDGNVWHAHSNNDGATVGFSSWGKPSGVSFRSKLGAASWGVDRYDVLGVGSNGNVYHRRLDHGTYSGWQNWGKPSGCSSISSSVAASSGEGDAKDWPRRINFVVRCGAQLYIGASLNGDTLATPPFDYVAVNAPPGTPMGDPDISTFMPYGLAIVTLTTDGHARRGVWNLDTGSFDWSDLGVPSGSMNFFGVGSAGWGDARFLTLFTGYNGTSRLYEREDDQTYSGSFAALNTLSSVTNPAATSVW